MRVSHSLAGLYAGLRRACSSVLPVMIPRVGHNVLFAGALPRAAPLNVGHLMAMGQKANWVSNSAMSTMGHSRRFEFGLITSSLSQ